MNIHELYQPFLKYFRTKRMQQFEDRFELTKDTQVLDVGGGEYNWLFLSVKPCLTILNVQPPARKYSNISYVVADGRNLPFQDRAFHIIYSNSVIEHLKSFENQQLFATECQSVGHGYYVQTPNKWFFMEPHLITPFIHWLPYKIQRLLLRNFTVWGWITRPTSQYCESFMNEVRLLDERELKQLFPEGKIFRECFLGIVKSIMAVKITSH